MSIITSRGQRRQLERDNAKQPAALTLLNRNEWPSSALSDSNRLQVWRSRNFLVQAFTATPPAVCRLSINRATVEGDRWAQNITWEELQQIKRECGYWAHTAVEVFPPDRDVVNVANMRHLWVLPEALPFAWKRS